MKRAAKKRKEGSTSRTRGEVAAGVEENVCRKAFKVDCGHFRYSHYVNFGKIEDVTSSHISFSFYLNNSLKAKENTPSSNNLYDKKESTPLTAPLRRHGRFYCSHVHSVPARR